MAAKPHHPNPHRRNLQLWLRLRTDRVEHLCLHLPGIDVHLRGLTCFSTAGSGDEEACSQRASSNNKMAG